jgi:glycosyltransferase involved in cell wall biosynthesis
MTALDYPKIFVTGHEIEAPFDFRPRRPVRVLMYGPGGSGGLARYTKDVCTALGRLADVTWATTVDASSPGADAFKVRPIWSNGGRRGRNSSAPGGLRATASKAVLHARRNLALVRWMVAERRSFDLLHCQFFMPLIDWPSLLTVTRSIPTVFTVHNVNLQDPLFTPLRRQEVWLLNRVLLSAAGLIVHSQGLVSALKDSLGRFEGQIGVVPLGVPTVNENSSPAWLNALSPELEGKLVLLQFGGVRPVKGLEILFNALAQLPAELRSRLHLLVVGETAPRYAQYAHECRRLISAWALDKTVTWVDRFIAEEEIPAVFAVADWAVFPYKQYLSASAALSWAYACGVPVIVSSAGALGEYVESDETGVCFREGDASELAGCILKVSDNPVLRQTLAGSFDRLRRSETYNWRRCAVLTEQFYRRVLDRS